MVSAAGIEIPEKEIVRTVVRQLSSDFDVVKRSTLTSPGLSRYDVEKIIRDSYARRKAAELRKSGGSASGSPAACGLWPLVVTRRQQSLGGNCAASTYVYRDAG